MADLDTEERNWSVLAHASAAVTNFFVPSFGFLGPLVVWFLRKDQSERVARHARQAMIFQGAMAIAAWVLGAVGSALACVGIGLLILPLAFVPWLAGVVVPLLAANKVNNGEDDYVYPMVGHLDAGSQPRLH